MTNKATFIATMRRPEMRLLRAALWDMKWQHNIPWETITSIEISPPCHENDVWMLLTDHHEIVCFWPEEKSLAFSVWPLDDEREDSQTLAIAQPTNA